MDDHDGSPYYSGGHAVTVDVNSHGYSPCWACLFTLAVAVPLAKGRLYISSHPAFFHALFTTRHQLNDKKTLGLLWSKRTRSLKLKCHGLYAALPLDSVDSLTIKYGPKRKVWNNILILVWAQIFVQLSTYAHLPSAMLLTWIMSLGSDSISHAQLLLHTLQYHWQRPRWFFCPPWVSHRAYSASLFAHIERVTFFTFALRAKISRRTID